MDPAPGFSYKYSLFVDGKPFEQFKHSQAKALRIWESIVGDNKYRVVLGKTDILFYFHFVRVPKRFFTLYFCVEKDTLNIFVNGLLREEEVGQISNEFQGNLVLMYLFAYRVNLLTLALIRNGNKMEIILF